MDRRSFLTRGAALAAAGIPAPTAGTAQAASAAAPAATLPPRQEVVRTESAEDAGASLLIPNRTTAQARETFEPVTNRNGSTSLRAQANGKYVTAAAAGASALIAGAATIGTWEQFDLVAL
ncbi:hypothetical protein GA0115240_11548 [Streptomyces sp. DvalAA-14]|uniref:fascin domain-containing protein n=1 Tax=unclassified Streptomyces TaxID=2593676 RepID=UPI00081AFC7D|nr:MULTISPECIES: hypothetical protein [unclassified Streptomyces]MYS19987.1 hypothetical protein [Streptomyces sp. SID4948]SCD58204.1 hypothetical protein GA0115240_11548 [Streptomyces sp. DvalAA-14]